VEGELKALAQQELELAVEVMAVLFRAQEPMVLLTPVAEAVEMVEVDLQAELVVLGLSL
jgi:hypothetical protein